MKPAVALFVTLVALAAIVGTFLVIGAYPQDPGYHNFADKRAFFGVPNFWNVVSNLPFLVVGLMSWTRKRVFALGLIITAFGSGLYHWNPNNSTLIWDRVGIVIGAVFPRAAHHRAAAGVPADEQSAWPTGSRAPLLCDRQTL